MTIQTPTAKDVESIEAGFDVEAIRADFPILSEMVHGKPLTDVDNGASSLQSRADDSGIQAAQPRLHLVRIAEYRQAVEAFGGERIGQFVDGRVPLLLQQRVEFSTVMDN